MIIARPRVNLALTLAAGILFSGAVAAQNPPADGGQASERPAALATGPDVVNLEFQDHRLFHELLGRQDEHVKAIEKSLGVDNLFVFLVIIGYFAVPRQL